jgi:membrane-associated phospholipid phosphatase
VPTELGFRILPRRAFWSASIMLGTAIISLGLIAVVFVRVMNHAEIRQFRCLQNGEHGTICGGTWDNQTCVEGSICSPDPCGSKLLVGLDISVAGATNGNSTAVDVLAELMIGWSLVPYLTILFLLAGALLLRSTAALSPLGLFLIIVALNEGVVKRVLQSPRPVGSCMFGLSYGMPSGHAASSIGLLTYLLLETNCDRPELSVAVKSAASLLLLLALAPVPFSRVYLQDHSPAQAVAGAIAGAALGAAWFAGLYGGAPRRALPPAHLSAIGRAWQRLGIRHTYRRRSAPLLLVLGVWSPNHHDQPPPPEIKAPGFSA